MSEIIGQVAKAIYEKRNGPGCLPWHHQTKGHKAPYLADARAAIEAMREPMPSMTEAMRYPNNEADSWRAAIDAALAM